MTARRDQAPDPNAPVVETRDHEDNLVTLGGLYLAIAQAFADYTGAVPSVPVSDLTQIVRIGNALDASYAIYPLDKEVPQ